MTDRSIESRLLSLIKRKVLPSRHRLSKSHAMLFKLRKSIELGAVCPPLNDGKRNHMSHKDITGAPPKRSRRMESRTITEPVFRRFSCCGLLEFDPQISLFLLCLFVVVSDCVA